MPVSIIVDESNAMESNRHFVPSNRLVTNRDTMSRKKRVKLNPFAKILRSLMSDRGLTVREAAKLAGVGISTVDSWRSGAFPEDYLAVRQLAKGLGVSLSFILTGEEDDQSVTSSPAVSQVFSDGGTWFDGYAKITIQRLLPRNEKKGDKS